LQLYLRGTTSTIWTALNEANSTDAILHIIFTARKTGDGIAAKYLRCTGTNRFGPNEPTITANARYLAAFTVVLIRNTSTTAGFRGHRQATSVTDTQKVFGALATTFNVLAIIR
jgi:hypothetical protein